MRTVAVVAFAGTAALAVVLTSAPEQAALTADDLACTASGLATRVGATIGGPVGATVGGPVGQGVGQGTVPRLPTSFTLEFINISDRTCVLDGYPSVDAFAGARQVGSPATLDTSVRPHTVTLAPGGAAHATLRYTGTERFGHAACREVTASRLRVYPPQQQQAEAGAGAGAEAVFVPWHIPACSRRGPHFLSVAAIQPRTGALTPLKY